MLSGVEHEKGFITSGPDPTLCLAWSGYKLLDTQTLFLVEILVKSNYSFSHLKHVVSAKKKHLNETDLFSIQSIS